MSNILDHLRCFTKFKMGTCYKTCIREIEEEIIFLINESNEISQKINYFNEIAKGNRLNNEVLSFDKERIIRRKRIFLPKIDNIDGYKKCPYKVDECNAEFEKLEVKHSKLLSEVLNNQCKYNNIVNVVLDIEKYLKDNENNDITKIYVNFKEDKNEDLICILFDFSKFNVNRNSMPDLVGLFGEYHFNHNKLKMLLDYSSTCSHLEIVDFFTGKPWCGHASLALECLDDIVKIVDTLIERYNDSVEDKALYANKIIKITGRIGPSTGLMTSARLVEFYRKRGFYNDGGFGKKIL